MSIPTISAAEAHRRLTNGSAVLIDIREPNEHARESISGARLTPLSSLDAAQVAAHRGGQAIIFHCQSGRRTSDNAMKLRSCGASDLYQLEGGLNGWKAAGLKTNIDHSKPIEMQRQVQIVAGSLVLAGLLLALLISPWFAAVSAFIGAGLVFAGASGWCGMAHLLGAMPWNRPAV
jgi:rhodanese-related sulfurtransferase